VVHVSSVFRVQDGDSFCFFLTVVETVRRSGQEVYDSSTIPHVGDSFQKEIQKDIFSGGVLRTHLQV